jgi:hypothetical protein
VVEDVSKPAIKNTKAWAARESIDRSKIRVVKSLIESSHVTWQAKSERVPPTRYFKQSEINLNVYKDYDTEVIKMSVTEETKFILFTKYPLSVPRNVETSTVLRWEKYDILNLKTFEEIN